MKIYINEKTYNDFESALWTFDDETPNDEVSDFDDFMKILHYNSDGDATKIWRRERGTFAGEKYINIFYKNKLLAFAWRPFNKLLQLDTSSDMANGALDMITSSFNLSPPIDCSNQKYKYIVKVTYKRTNHLVSIYYLVDNKDSVDSLTNPDLTGTDIYDFLNAWKISNEAEEIGYGNLVMFPNDFVLRFSSMFDRNDPYSNNTVIGVYKIVETIEVEL